MASSTAAAVLEGQGSSRGKSQDAGGGNWGTPHRHTAPQQEACLQQARWEPVMKVGCLVHDPRGAFCEETHLDFEITLDL